MDAEHAAQQLGDGRNVELDQQEGGRRQEKITHRKKQDDNSGQCNAICAHAITLLFSEPGQGFGRQLMTIPAGLSSAIGLWSDASDRVDEMRRATIVTGKSGFA